MAAAENPGRGIMILVFGILSLVCCTLFGPIAWILGRQDLAQIRRGVIASDAEQMTKIGMILGIVGTCLLALQLVGGCVFFIIVALTRFGSTIPKTMMLQM